VQKKFVATTDSKHGCKAEPSPAGVMEVIGIVRMRTPRRKAAIWLRSCDIIGKRDNVIFRRGG
jgi:hypothetical protein